MGLFGKLKNIFYDEEIVEVPVKEEIKKEEKRPRIEEVVLPKRETIEKPVMPKEQKTESSYSERDLFKSETTFKFPVIDEDDEIPVKTRTRSGNILELDKIETVRREIPKREAPKPYVKEESKKDGSFTPSPVISPIYGILDKNYKKEEIKQKKEITTRPSQSEMNYDYVRRKAYGTLEDELENTLTRMSNEVLDSVNELEEEIDSIPDNNKSIEDLLTEIEGNANVSIGEIEEAIKDKQELEEESKSVSKEIEFKRKTNDIEENEKEEEEIGDKTLEHDLFNLIDSMYESKEGDE